MKCASQLAKSANTRKAGINDLVQAILQADLSEVKSVLRAGVDPNAAVPTGVWGRMKGWTALGLAYHWLHRKPWPALSAILRALVSAGADINKPSPTRSPLNLAAHRNDLNAARWFLRHGADPSGPSILLPRMLRGHPKGGFCCTALHVAAAGGHVAMAKLLVRYGANPSTRDFNGKAPWELALEFEHEQLAAFLKQPN